MRISRTILAFGATFAALLAPGAGIAAATVAETTDASQWTALNDRVGITATFCPGEVACGVGQGADPALPLAAGQRLQYLVGFLVPDGSGPEVSAGAFFPDGNDVEMERRPSLDESLQALRPAPAGLHWLGYATPALAAPAALGSWATRTATGFTRGAGGLPEPATYRYAVMGGVRVATTADEGPLRAGRPIDCTEATTWCGPSSAERSFALRDVRGSGATVTATAGTSATLPFTLRQTGAAGGVPLTLTAATAIAGAGVTPARTTVPAGAGFTDVDVRVRIPAGTAPGRYDVELVAAADGDERRALATLVVAAPAARGDADASVDGDDEGDAPGTVDLGGAGSSVVTATPRAVVFAGVARAALRRDGSADLGEIRCHKTWGFCSWITVRVTARVRGVVTVVGRAYVVVAARERARAVVQLGAIARRLLRDGRTLKVTVAVRASPRAEAMVEHVTLRGA